MPRIPDADRSVINNTTAQSTARRIILLPIDLSMADKSATASRPSSTLACVCVCVRVCVGVRTTAEPCMPSADASPAAPTAHAHTMASPGAPGQPDVHAHGAPPTLDVRVLDTCVSLMCRLRAMAGAVGAGHARDHAGNDGDDDGDEAGEAGMRSALPAQPGAPPSVPRRAVCGRGCGHVCAGQGGGEEGEDARHGHGDARQGRLDRVRGTGLGSAGSGETGSGGSGGCEADGVAFRRLDVGSAEDVAWDAVVHARMWVPCGCSPPWRRRTDMDARTGAHGAGACAREEEVAELQSRVTRALEELQRALHALAGGWTGLHEVDGADDALLACIASLAVVEHAHTFKTSTDGGADNDAKLAVAEELCRLGAVVEPAGEGNVIVSMFSAIPSLAHIGERLRGYRHASTELPHPSSGPQLEQLAVLLACINHPGAPRHRARRRRVLDALRQGIINQMEYAPTHTCVLLPSCATVGIPGVFVHSAEDGPSSTASQPPTDDALLSTDPRVNPFAAILAEVAQAHERSRAFMHPMSPVSKAPHLLGGHTLNIHHLVAPATEALRTAGWCVAMLRGNVAYYHYGQDGLRDNGWGCAYRSLQSIASWCIYNGIADAKLAPGMQSALAQMKAADLSHLKLKQSAPQVPSHTEIQSALVELGDKPAAFVGTREWIGSQEVAYVLEHIFGIQSQILFCPNPAAIARHADAIEKHFAKGGGPIMIGGGVLAFTIVGVAVQPDAGSSEGSIDREMPSLGKDMQLLIIDPHYAGADAPSNYTRIAALEGYRAAPVSWRSISALADGHFYNLCLPQPPEEC